MKKVIFARVVENALDFFNHSTKELNKHPKYSLIHFCAAVELFVKARLMLEHWSLIVAKPDAADWGKFCKGDFVSVGLPEAQKRLKSVVNDALSDEELAAFNKLVAHRNQLVHFHHEDQQDKAALIERVVAEQLPAWFYLHRLLTERWRNHFPKLGARLSRLETTMRKHREYLSAKFNAMKNEINEEEAKGARYEDCPACGFHSAYFDREAGELYRPFCKVCHWHCLHLEIECPNCKNTVSFRNEGRGVCKQCEKHFEPKDLVALYTDISGEYLLATDGDDSSVNSNCFACPSEGTVVPFNDAYLCMNCFLLSQNRWHCSVCGTLINVKSEAGPWGCVACFNS